MLSCHRIVFQTNELDKSARSHFASGVRLRSGLIEHSLCVSRAVFRFEPLPLMAVQSIINCSGALTAHSTFQFHDFSSAADRSALLRSPTLSIRRSLLSTSHLERSGLPLPQPPHAIRSAPRCLCTNAHSSCKLVR